MHYLFKLENKNTSHLKILKLNLSHSMIMSQTRCFSILIPNKKLHFIKHPVHGKVYPVAKYHKESVKPRRKIAIFSSLTMLNTTAFYSLFIEAILQNTPLAIICNPSILIPSLILNYVATEYIIMFYAKRDMIINLYLKENGKQIIAETYNGEVREVSFTLELALHL